MNRGEAFALGAGVLALALALAAAGLLLPPAADAPVRRDAVPALVLSAAVLYAWVVVAWVLVRRSIHHIHGSTHSRSSGTSRFARRLAQTLVGTALLVLPILMVIVSSRVPTAPADSQESALEASVHWFAVVGGLSLAAVLVAGTLMFFALRYLMPVVYRDLRHP